MEIDNPDETVAEETMGVEENNGCLSMFVDNGSVESHRLYLARRTVLEMLRDRGYGVSVTEMEQSLADFRGLYGDHPDLDQLKVTAVLLRDPLKKILVIFCDPHPIKMPIIRNLYTQYGSESWSRMILVLQSNLTTQARENLKHIFPFKVETFQITELLINVTKHTLIPHHEKLSPEEKDQLLKKYNIQEKQLPRMLENDAIARYYGYEKGTVLKITYASELTKDHFIYRCVM